MSDHTYVANSRRAWGKGQFETEAINNLAARHSKFNDTEEIELFKVMGFDGFQGRKVLCDEMLSQEIIEVDGDRLKELHELHSQAELLAEDILVKAQE